MLRVDVYETDDGHCQNISTNKNEETAVSDLHCFETISWNT